jgi:uncharacterized membrane protein YtjA (UPF0391 family)
LLILTKRTARLFSWQFLIIAIVAVVRGFGEIACAGTGDTAIQVLVSAMVFVVSLLEFRKESV